MNVIFILMRNCWIFFLDFLQSMLCSYILKVALLAEFSACYAMFSLFAFILVLKFVGAKSLYCNY